MDLSVHLITQSDQFQNSRILIGSHRVMGPALKVTSCDWLKFGPSVDVGFWCLNDQGKKPGPKLRNPLLTVDTFGDGPFSIALGPFI